MGTVPENAGDGYGGGVNEGTSRVPWSFLLREERGRGRGLGRGALSRVCMGEVTWSREVIRSPWREIEGVGRSPWQVGGVGGRGYLG